MTRVYHRFLLFFLGLGLGLAARFGGSIASADHPYAEPGSYLSTEQYPHKHIKGMNHADETENFCLTVYAHDVDYNWAFLKLIEKERNEGDADRDWHDIRYVRLLGSNVECPLYTPADTPFEIRFTVVDSIEALGICTGTSNAIGCTVRSAAKDYDDFSHHEEHRYATIYLEEVGLNVPWPLTDNIVNHEIGHALGLCDGGPGAPANPQCEAWEQHDECVDSIMHIYPDDWPPWQSCNFPPEWPTQNDTHAVEALVPQGGTGHGTGGNCKAFSGCA